MTYETIVSQLDEWAKAPQSTDEDELISPSLQAIRVARVLVGFAQKSGIPAPKYFSRGGAGDIAANWLSAQIRIGVEDDGGISLTMFSSGNLLLHHTGMKLYERLKQVPF